MYLRKLEVHGFKSFAKKTLLEFEPGITSVVGPNGSGKSNIADSLRWVFGEQSMKLLRSKKSEDVIFAGSDQKARLGSAEVSVSFDNTDRIMPVDYAEVAVTRRVYRDGNSEYLINGSQVRLLDIQELLAKSGFGNTSYHVIGQGAIDQLILGGPAAIKELLEEASGVKPYYQKRESALRKLERTETNLGQVSALVAEIEPRLRSLRRQTRKFEQRAEIQKELRHAQALHYNQALGSLEAQTAEVTGKIGIFDKQLGKLTREIAEFAKDIETEERQRGEDKKEAALLGNLQNLQKSKLGLLEEQAVLRGKLKAGQLQSAGAGNTNWQEIKNKFKQAHEQLRAFLRNFKKWQLDPESAAAEGQRIEKLFEELSREMDGGKNSTRAPELENEQQRLHQLDEELAGLATSVNAAETAYREYAESAKEQKNQLFVKERLLRNKQDALAKTKDQKNSLQIEQAKLQTRQEALANEVSGALGSEFANELAAVRGQAVPAGLLEKIQRLAKQLGEIGGVDDMLVQEYKETGERHEYLTTQSADLTKGVADLKAAITDLDEVIKKEFDDAFGKISEKFGEYFRILFGGGKATMNMLRENFQITGIEIRATPPGKKLGGTAALSGGERALTAIALLSAILATYPSPFVVLDEVDAALDEANSIRFGKILGTLADKTQFITITHNRETMRQSHTLYGVTMGDDGVSKLLSLKLEQAAAYSTKN